MDRPFATRRQAGKKLASKLISYMNRPDVLVLALPRGGVPVGYEVARALPACLDVFVVRKLGMPGYEEFALGAIATGGVRVLNEELIRATGISQSLIDASTSREHEELQRRERLYRGARSFPDVRGRTVILVDDGLATGSTMRAAALALRKMQPSKLIVAVPVGAQETCDEFRDDVDEVVCAIAPVSFKAVGAWYADFSQTSDAEVRELLQRAGTHENQSVFHPD
jgi:predicted phosphoribosyltransferase